MRPHRFLPLKFAAGTFALWGTLPSFAFAQPLQSLDLRGESSYVHGAPHTAGETKESADGRTVELVAHGTEFGHHCEADQGRFAYTELDGDFDVVVQVAQVTNHGATQFYSTQPTVAKAGIVAREGNDPRDRYVGIWAVSNDAGEYATDAFQFDWRKARGAWLGNQPEGVHPHLGDAAASFVYGYVNRQTPRRALFERRFPDVWLRLQRRGGSFFAWIGRDGRTWFPTTIEHHDTDLPRKLHVGVALAAAGEGTVDARAEAVFKNVSGLRPPPASAPFVGPLKVSASGRYFTTEGGRPFFWLGDTAWPLFTGYSPAEAERYIRRRAEQGFTVIHSGFAWGLVGEREAASPRPNPQGDKPWLDDNPATPNEAYFRYVDHLVAYAGRLGVTLAIMPSFGFYIVDRPLINLTNARTYGRWLGQRYKDAKNIVWVGGGDRIPLNYEEVHRELARGLHEGSAGAHLVSYHPSGWRSSAEYFHEERWLDFNMIQTWGWWPRVYDAVVSDALRTPPKPVVLSEGAYEEGAEYPLGPITPLIVRRQAWWTAMAGGSFTYGHTQNWRMDPGWESMLDSPGAAQVGRMREILSRFAWWDMVPDQGVFLSGVGSERTLNAALVAKDGKRALVYLSSQCHVLINLEKFHASQVKVSWIDPITGHEFDAGTYATGNYNDRPFPDRAQAYFSTPDFWEDALLLIEDAAAR